MDSEKVSFEDLVARAGIEHKEGLVAPNAIPTTYKGVTFRSKLEARWAVFFDTLGIEWEYEPQGYKIGYSYVDGQKRFLMSNGEIDYKDDVTEVSWRAILERWEEKGITVIEELPPLGDLDPALEWYLPDFWLPELKLWVEVKGKVGESEIVTGVRAVDGWSKNLPGIEDISSYDQIGVSGLLYLGDIPNPARNPQSGAHVLFGRRKGVTTHAARFRLNKSTDRVEVELGTSLGYYFDVLSVSDGVLDEYSRDTDDLARAMVKGLSRSVYSDYRSTTSPDDSWQLEKYPPISEDLFGESVIAIGWETARNYKF